ncbi:adenine nucleotide alpha hydrolases-like protein [Lichtheimia hyalospora FSU 10163]|nr:adenine nucleotide alpha hydrolases-like protein [Lichtheimia hyalospora FSU 10163]
MATSTNSSTLQLPDTFLSAPPQRGSTPSRLQGRKIVVAYDESRASDAILDRVIRTGLLEPDDDIHLVHILQQHDFFSSLTPKNLSSNLYHNMPAGYDMSVGRSVNDNEDDLVKNVKEDLLLAVADVLKKHSFNNVHCEVIQGDPKESLIDYCRSVHPLMMMTGSRGFGKVKSSILGSVSEYLAKHCPCPVMIVKVTEAEIEARNKMSEEKQKTFRQRLADLGLPL